MPPTPGPSTAIDAYKAIIDQIATETTPGLHARLLRSSGRYSNAPADVDGNAFAATLTPAQREVLAKMLNEERASAIHDVLADLTWWIISRGVTLAYRGEPMPVDLSGMGLHGDYVGRLDGWDWPTGEANEST